MVSSLFLAGAAAEQMTRSNRAQAAGARASRMASEVRAQNESMEYDIEKLFMITEAMWEILKYQHGYTDEQLVQMIQDIDLRDGKLNGKVASPAERPECAQCGRTIIRRQARCLYCGAPAPSQPFDR